MRSLGTGDRFFETVRIVGGPRTRASIQRASLTDNPQIEFTYPKITCRVPLKSLVTAGQVLLLEGGDYYLVANHSATGDYKIFHLFRADRQMAWTRVNIDTDTLTGLAKATRGPQIPLDNIWVMSERVNRQLVDSQLHFSAENIIVATGADVQLNDFLDGQLVKRRSVALGITVLELQA